MPRRILADWTPGDGPADEWLASAALDGWVPEYEWGGVEIEMNGQRFTRWAMINRCPRSDVPPAFRQKEERPFPKLGKGL